MLILGNQANFWASAWWRFVYSDFHTAILRLFQTFIFRRNLLIELWELFYHSYFDKQFYQIWQLIYTKYSGSCIIDRFYLDTFDACTDVNMPQPRQLTCIWPFYIIYNLQLFQKNRCQKKNKNFLSQDCKVVWDFHNDLQSLHWFGVWGTWSIGATLTMSLRTVWKVVREYLTLFLKSFFFDS